MAKTSAVRADLSARFCAPRAQGSPRQALTRREITAAQLKEVEDREIEKIIKKQEEVGLQCATDGEFRRSWCIRFYGMLDGGRDS